MSIDFRPRSTVSCHHYFHTLSSTCKSSTDARMPLSQVHHPPRPYSWLNDLTNSVKSREIKLVIKTLTPIFFIFYITNNNGSRSPPFLLSSIYPVPQRDSATWQLNFLMFKIKITFFFLCSLTTAYRFFPLITCHHCCSHLLYPSDSSVPNLAALLLFHRHIIVPFCVILSFCSVKVLQF
jgi:hypothetical protein